MKYCYFLLLFLFLAGCSISNSKNYQVPEYEKMADRITAKTAKKIEKETGLRLCGTGGGMMNHIRMMAMSFDCSHEIDIEQARELVLHCANEYLNAINSNEEIRPHLVQYPFMPKNVQIDIFIHPSDQREIPTGSLVVVSTSYGMISYMVRGTGSERLKDVHEETYEEAVKIVEQKSLTTS